MGYAGPIARVRRAGVQDNGSGLPIVLSTTEGENAINLPTQQDIRPMRNLMQLFGRGATGKSQSRANSLNDDSDPRVEILYVQHCNNFNLHVVFHEPGGNRENWLLATGLTRSECDTALKRSVEALVDYFGR